MNAWPGVKNGMIVLVPPSAARTETTATSIFSFMCTVLLVSLLLLSFGEGEIRKVWFRLKTPDDFLEALGST